MAKITVGADPEVFLGLKGQFVSAHNLLPGTKWDPFPVNKGAIQVDGMAAEFNIDPAEDEESFISNLDIVLSQLKEFVPDHEVLPTPSVTFTKDFLKDIPLQALVLGCDPDFNAYTRGVNPRPNGNKPMRTAGGHVHIGGFESDNIYEANHFNDMCRLSTAMDQTIGVYSVLWDKDDKRRSMYGNAGTFRPKTYGMEYRTLSNAWLFNKKLQGFVYRGVLEAVGLMDDRKWLAKNTARLIIARSDRNNDFFKGNTKADEVRDILAAA
jgi:hypothetical protein